MRILPLLLATLCAPLSQILADAVNWPIPSVGSGQNSAIVAAPRNDWMEKFQANLDRTKKGDARIIFDGDSITDWWRTNGRTIWESTFLPLGAADFAIAGDRTEQVLWRLDNGQGKGMHPKLIVLMIGTNNLGRNTDAQIAEGVSAIVKQYRQEYPSATILLQGIFPRGQSASDPARGRIKNINSMISKLQDGSKVIYLDFGDKFLEPDGTISREIMRDFLHPTAQGYKIWLDAIKPTVDKVLK